MTPGNANAETSMRTRTASAPTGWPPDPKHTYALWLQPVESTAVFRAYVTAHPVYRDIGTHSRFAERLDLPGVYANKAAATAAAYAAAARFFRGKNAPDRLEQSKSINNYRMTAHARFRIDCHEWEPVLTIKRHGHGSNAAVQTFDGGDSPFVRSTFPTPSAAISYALTYGERLVLGIIRGLRV